MAEIYHTEFVPEVAREMISSNEFTVEDIIHIGQAQTQRIKDKLKTANKILFCDTDLITTQIYSKLDPRFYLRSKKKSITISIFYSILMCLG